MAVSANYRRRTNDGLYALSEDAQRRPVQLSDGVERRHTNRPVIFLGMIKILYQASKRNGFDYWVAAMEQSLIRHLVKWQIVFQPIGPEIDYYGPISPYFVEVANIERRMSQKHA